MIHRHFIGIGDGKGRIEKGFQRQSEIMKKVKPTMETLSKKRKKELLFFF